MLDIGGQLCTNMCMTTANLVMHVKEQEDWHSKSCKTSYESSRGTIYEMGT